jgi:hypothetical protein
MVEEIVGESCGEFVFYGLTASSGEIARPLPTHLM